MKKQRRILVIYWILYYLLTSLIEAGPGQYYYESFTSNLMTLPVKFLFVTVVTGPLIVGFLLKKRMAAFFTLYFSILFLSTLLLRWVDNYIVLEYILTHWTRQPLLSTPPLLYCTIKLQFVAAIPFTLKLFSYWMATELRHSELLQQQTRAELNFLRDQIQPHFLFNALNTLYAKTVTDPPAASELVLKLCALLRTSLYECGQAPVLLSGEIEYLKNYTDLQKMRFEGSIEVSFSVFGKTGSQRIEPLLILPWIENGFKHCLPDREGNRWVTIQLMIEHSYIIAQVDNSYKPKAGNAVADGGIGHANVRKRLELLYPGDHILRCHLGEDNYYVYLKIPLT